ncbi:YjfB family protein [Lachnospiraceae bacterium ZAX-1]
MDIASLSTALSLSTGNGDVGIAVLSKQLDIADELGASMIKALEQSVNPNLGSNIDISI